MKYLLALPLMLLMVSGAYAAEPYVKGGAWLSNLSDYSTDNLGFTGEIGLQGEFFAGGIEISNHRHLGDSVLGIAANAYVYPVSLGPVDLYGMVGIGASDRGVILGKVYDDKKELVAVLRDDNQPFTQAALGAEWNLTDSVALYGEGRIRLYHEGWGDILDVGGDKDAGFLLGGKVSF